jgi:hypothetical protein
MVAPNASWERTRAARADHGQACRWLRPHAPEVRWKMECRSHNRGFPVSNGDSNHRVSRWNPIECALVSVGRGCMASEGGISCAPSRSYQSRSLRYPYQPLERARTVRGARITALVQELTAVSIRFSNAWLRFRGTADIARRIHCTRPHGIREGSLGALTERR